jgi:hypothetical protein
MPRDLKTSTIPTRDSWRLLRRLLPISFAVALTLTFGTTDAWAKANATSPVTETAPSARTEEPARTSESTAPAFDDAYAQREQTAPGLENFEGGDVVIISASTGLIILLIILLILLL